MHSPSTFIPIGRDNESSNVLMIASALASVGARRRNSKSMVGEITFREEIADRTPSKVLFGHNFCAFVHGIMHLSHLHESTQLCQVTAENEQ